MTGWKTVALRDVAAVFDGPHATPAKTEAGPWYLSISSLNNGRFDFAQSAHLSVDDLPRWTKRVAPRPGDTLFSYETRLGQAAYWEHDVDSALGRRMGLLRPKAGEVEPRYLSYAYLGPQFQSVIREKTLSGATVDRIPVGEMPTWPILLPPITEQRTILEILGSIDDLIENNRRRVAVLEEMARAIYREWFVKFRYPGHEDVPLVDSALGPIPEGWTTPHLADLVSTQYGYTESATTVPLGPKYLRGMDINKTSFIDWSSVPYCLIDEATVDRFRVQVGDVFVIRMADPGKVGMCETEVDAVFASYLVRIRPSAANLRSYFLFFTLADARYQGWVTGASTGATRKSVSAKVMAEPRIALPPVGLQLRFEGAIGPMREGLTTLVRENARLAELRDLLLPKLVTGKIDVSALALGDLVA